MHIAQNLRKCKEEIKNLFAGVSLSHTKNPSFNGIASAQMRSAIGELGKERMWQVAIKGYHGLNCYSTNFFLSSEVEAEQLRSYINTFPVLRQYPENKIGVAYNSGANLMYYRNQQSVVYDVYPLHEDRATVVRSSWGKNYYSDITST